MKYIQLRLSDEQYKKLTEIVAHQFRHNKITKPKITNYFIEASIEIIHKLINNKNDEKHTNKI